MNLDDEVVIDVNTFYVYLLVDPRNDLTFYVGKGSGGRMYEHEKEALRGIHHNKKLENKIRKIKSLGLSVIYDKIFESNDEQECYRMENYVVEGVGLNSLCNLTSGGLGGTRHSEETRKKLSGSYLKFLGSLSKEDRKAYFDHITFFRNASEVRKRISDTLKLFFKTHPDKHPSLGCHWGDEMRSRISDGVTWYFLTHPDAAEKCRERMKSPEMIATANRNMLLAQEAMRTPEMRAKLSQWASARFKGCVNSEETKKKKSISSKIRHAKFIANGGVPYFFKNPFRMTGKHHKEETKAKMSERASGRPKSEEHKRKLSEVKKGKCLGSNNPNFGRKWTPEMKERMSLLKRAKVVINNGIVN